MSISDLSAGERPIADQKRGSGTKVAPSRVLIAKRDSTLTPEPR